MWQRARENLQHRLVRLVMALFLVGSPLFAMAAAFFRHEPLLQHAMNGLFLGILLAISMLFSRNLFKKGMRIDWRV